MKSATQTRPDDEDIDRQIIRVCLSGVHYANKEVDKDIVFVFYTEFKSEIQYKWVL